MAAFESATDAVRAAVAIQQRIARDFHDLHIRVGVAAGDVSWEDGDCFGMPVVTASHLQARADGDQIIASALVRLLAGDRAGVGFRPLGSLELAGLNDPVEAYEVEWSPLDGDGDGGFRVPLPGALVVAPSLVLLARTARGR